MDVRQAVIETWGPMWERVPLEPHLEDEEDHEGCLLRYVTIQTSPKVRVPGALFLPPTSKRNGAGVLCVHQHAGQFHIGKSEPIGKQGDPEMFYALELTQRGYVTFTIDLWAFEKRQQPPQEERRKRLDGSWYERFVATALFLQGQTLKGRYVWDLHRALDFLAEQVGEGEARLGAIGHSLGGQTTLDIMLFDKRIAAGVCSCGISTWDTILRDQVNHNMAAYAPGSLRIADTDDIVAALAPRAFFMSSGTEDYIFPIDGVQQIGKRAAEGYAAAGVPERFCQRIFPGGHGFPAEIREEAYAWLDRWLLA